MNPVAPPEAAPQRPRNVPTRRMTPDEERVTLEARKLSWKQTRGQKPDRRGGLIVCIKCLDVAERFQKKHANTPTKDKILQAERLFKIAKNGPFRKAPAAEGYLHENCPNRGGDNV